MLNSLKIVFWIITVLVPLVYAKNASSLEYSSSTGTTSASAYTKTTTTSVHVASMISITKPQALTTLVTTTMPSISMTNVQFTSVMASASNAAQIAATASVLPPNQAVVYGIPVSIMDGQAVVNNVPISIASVVLPYPVFSIYEAQFTTEIVQLFTLECAGTQIVQSRSVSVTIPISASVTIDSVPVQITVISNQIAINGAVDTTFNSEVGAGPVGALSAPQAGTVLTSAADLDGAISPSSIATLSGSGPKVTDTDTGNGEIGAGSPVTSPSTISSGQSSKGTYSNTSATYLASISPYPTDSSSSTNAAGDLTYAVATSPVSACSLPQFTALPAVNNTATYTNPTTGDIITYDDSLNQFSFDDGQEVVYAKTSENLYTFFDPANGVLSIDTAGILTFTPIACNQTYVFSPSSPLSKRQTGGASGSYGDDPASAGSAPGAQAPSRESVNVFVTVIDTCNQKVLLSDGFDPHLRCALGAFNAHGSPQDPTGVGSVQMAGFAEPIIEDFTAEISYSPNYYRGVCTYPGGSFVDKCTAAFQAGNQVYQAIQEQQKKDGVKQLPTAADIASHICDPAAVELTLAFPEFFIVNVVFDVVCKNAITKLVNYAVDPTNVCPVLYSAFVEGVAIELVSNDATFTLAYLTGVNPYDVVTSLTLAASTSCSSTSSTTVSSDSSTTSDVSSANQCLPMQKRQNGGACISSPVSTPALTTTEPATNSNEEFTTQPAAPTTVYGPTTTQDSSSDVNTSQVESTESSVPQVTTTDSESITTGPAPSATPSEFNCPYGTIDSAYSETSCDCSAIIGNYFSCPTQVDNQDNYECETLFYQGLCCVSMGLDTTSCASAASGGDSGGGDGDDGDDGNGGETDEGDDGGGGGGD